MKNVPNDTVATLCRCLPLILDNLDTDAVRKSLRLQNAVRLLKHEVLPKLNKIKNEKRDLRPE